MKNIQHNTALQIWGAPLLLALLTLFGLVAALVGTGIWHGLAWLALTVPVAACIGYGWLKPRKERSTRRPTHSANDQGPRK